jgi:hypothetical protein
MTDAHSQKITHKYVVHYPDHPPRASDPHYIDFNHYHKLHSKDAKCAFADSADSDQCVLDKPLELHHRYIEFSLQNGVDFATLEKDFPGISNPNEVGAWVESDTNFEWLCQYHHRGAGGVHVSSASDFASERYVKDLISKENA